MRLRPSKRLVPILAMAAVLLNFEPAFACGTKQKAYVTAMRSDLRHLIVAQEHFVSEHGRYARSIEELWSGRFRLTTGVTAIAIDAQDGTGFSATATHAQTPAVCRIYAGPRPVGFDAGQLEGDAACEGGSREWILAGQAVGIFVLFFLIGLTLPSLTFLRGPRRFGWTGTGLTSLTVLFALLVILNSSCGLYPVALLAFFLVPALGLFTLAFWRHTRRAAAPT